MDQSKVFAYVCWSVNNDLFSPNISAELLLFPNSALISGMPVKLVNHLLPTGRKAANQAKVAPYYQLMHSRAKA